MSVSLYLTALGKGVGAGTPDAPVAAAGTAIEAVLFAAIGVGVYAGYSMEYSSDRKRTLVGWIAGLAWVIAVSGALAV